VKEGRRVGGLSRRGGTVSPSWRGSVRETWEKKTRSNLSRKSPPLRKKLRGKKEGTQIVRRGKRACRRPYTRFPVRCLFLRRGTSLPHVQEKKERSGGGNSLRETDVARPSSMACRVRIGRSEREREEKGLSRARLFRSGD